MTEGLIELGALVCTPLAPACPACPLRPACRAAAAGRPEEFPRPTARRRPMTRRRYAAVCFDADGLWLERRPLDGLLGGMWGFPQSDAPPAGVELGIVRHAYTHFQLELVIVRPTATGERGSADGAHVAGAQGEHVAWRRLPDLPLSGVDEKVLATLASLGHVDPFREPTTCAL